MCDPVFFKPSKEMYVVRVAAFAIVFLAPLAAAAPVEVPAVQKFHEAIMTSDNGTAVATDGHPTYPKAEEGGPNPMSKSDGDKSSFDAVFYIILALIVMEVCLLLFCLMCTVICECKKRRRKRTEEGPITLA